MGLRRPDLGETEHAEEGDNENDGRRRNPEHDGASGGRKDMEQAQFGPLPESGFGVLVGRVLGMGRRGIGKREIRDREVGDHAAGNDGGISGGVGGLIH